MAWKFGVHLRRAFWTLVILLPACAGCATGPGFYPPEGAVPRELNKVSIPEYVISPPDILQLNVIRLIPRPPHKLVALDTLLIQVEVTPKAVVLNIDPEKEPLRYKEEQERLRHILPGQPIDGLYRVEPDGKIDLGYDYGFVEVLGLTTPEAKEAIKTHLKERFKIGFDIRVQLAESQGLQQIRGDHLVRPDGMISLGSYGSVYVTGMSLEKAKIAVQEFLSPKFMEPEISLDVSGFNSMVYYVIFDLDGAGQNIERMPFTGNETVLDAISTLKGLPAGSDRFRIWVARPNAGPDCRDQVMPVDWQAITKKGSTGTNYQLMPGDRLYVAVDPFVEADGFLAKVLSPIERILGITLLGNSVRRSLGNTGAGGIGGGGF